MQTYKLASAQGTASFESIANLALFLTYKRCGTKWGHLPFGMSKWSLSTLPSRRRGRQEGPEERTAEPYHVCKYLDYW